MENTGGNLRKNLRTFQEKFEKILGKIYKNYMKKMKQFQKKFEKTSEQVKKNLKILEILENF